MYSFKMIMVNTYNQLNTFKHALQSFILLERPIVLTSLDKVIIVKSYHPFFCAALSLRLIVSGLFYNLKYRNNCSKSFDYMNSNIQTFLVAKNCISQLNQTKGVERGREWFMCKLLLSSQTTKDWNLFQTV